MCLAEMVVEHCRAVSAKDLMKPFCRISVFSGLGEKQAGDGSIGKADGGGYRGHIASLLWQRWNTLGIHAHRFGTAQPADHVETMAGSSQDQPSAPHWISHPDPIRHPFHRELTVNCERRLDELLHLQDCRRESKLEIHRECNTRLIGCNR